MGWARGMGLPGETRSTLEVCGSSQRSPVKSSSLAGLQEPAETCWVPPGHQDLPDVRAWPFLSLCCPGNPGGRQHPQLSILSDSCLLCFRNSSVSASALPSLGHRPPPRLQLCTLGHKPLGVRTVGAVSPTRPGDPNALPDQEPEAHVWAEPQLYSLESGYQGFASHLEDKEAKPIPSPLLVPHTDLC